MATQSASLRSVCHFARLPREIRDRIYDFTCQDTTSLVLVTPTLFTQLLFTSMPEPSLLRVCRQLRAEVALAISARTCATTLDAWDCQGAYDPLQRRNVLPRHALESVRELEVVLPTWSPIDNDLALVEAVLNYVRGVQYLTILFNNPTLALVKMKELKSCKVTRAWNASTYQYDLRFRHTTPAAPAVEEQQEQSEELLLQRWISKGPQVATVMIKTYVAGRWTDAGVYVQGHYAEVQS